MNLDPDPGNGWREVGGVGNRRGAVEGVTRRGNGAVVFVRGGQQYSCKEEGEGKKAVGGGVGEGAGSSRNGGDGREGDGRVRARMGSGRGTVGEGTVSIFL
jgi:hypothetical protein